MEAVRGVAQGALQLPIQGDARPSQAGVRRGGEEGLRGEEEEGHKRELLVL